MQRLEVSGAVRPIYGSLGVKRLIKSGDTLLHPLCAFTALTGKTLSIFSLLRFYIVNLLHTRKKCDHLLD